MAWNPNSLKSLILTTHTSKTSQRKKNENKNKQDKEPIKQKTNTPETKQTKENVNKELDKTAEEDRKN